MKVYNVNSAMLKIQIVLTLLWKISQVAFLILEIINVFFHKIVHIVNHLEYFCRISVIKPTDLGELPQFLPQSAKFLPRACSRRSRNIPSLHSSGSPVPAPQEQGTRLFTGNSAIDAGAAGAALGAAAQFIGRQIFNPCRGGTRGSNTNTRIVNGETLQNGALGFLAGFAGSSLVSNALGNPCGK